MLGSRAVHAHGSDRRAAGHERHQILDGLARGRAVPVGAAHREPRGHVGEVGEHVDKRTHLIEIGNRLDREEVRLGCSDHLEALAVEVDEPVVAHAVVTAVLAAVVEDGAVGAHTRRDERLTTGGRRTRDVHRSAQSGICLRLRAPRSEEPFARHLVAGGHDDPGTRIDVRLVDGANLLGLVGEDARGPQGIAEIVAALLEFGGEATVDGHDGPCEETARIGGAQM